VRWTCCTAYVCVCVCVCVHIYVCICMYVCMYVCVYIYVCMYVYIHICCSRPLHPLVTSQPDSQATLSSARSCWLVLFFLRTRHVSFRISLQYFCISASCAQPLQTIPPQRSRASFRTVRVCQITPNTECPIVLQCSIVPVQGEFPRRRIQSIRSQQVRPTTSPPHLSFIGIRTLCDSDSVAAAQVKQIMIHYIPKSSHAHETYGIRHFHNPRNLPTPMKREVFVKCSIPYRKLKAYGMNTFSSLAQFRGMETLYDFPETDAGGTGARRRIRQKVKRCLYFSSNRVPNHGLVKGTGTPPALSHE